MAQKFTDGVMDERIVRLNEFKRVKMAQLSKGKRPAAKFNKEVANYLLDNWDDVNALQRCSNNMHNEMSKGCEEVMEIYDKRVKELLAEDEAKKEREKAEHKSVHEQEPALNEDEVMRDIKVVLESSATKFFKEEGKMPIWYDRAIAWLEKQELKHAKRAAESASKKLTDKGMEVAQTITDGEIISKTAENKETTKAQTKSKGGEKLRRGRKSTHYVGEVHPVNPNWTWMEYLPGKFGWKSIRGKQGREQFPDRVPVEFKMPKKEVAGKAEKAEPAAAHKLTLTELLAKPTPSGLSKAQQNVIKAFKKGFRLRKDGDALWLTDAAGNNERVEKGVLEALQRRYKIDYIPNDVWYNG